MPESASTWKPINEGRPFSWMDKERQRRISDLVAPRHRHAVIATYATLALFANDSRDRIFDVWIMRLQEATGMSKNAVTRSLRTLEELQLMGIRHTKRRNGTFGPTRITLTKGDLPPLPLSPLEIGTGQKSHLEAKGRNAMASESHADHSPLHATKEGRSKEQRTRTKKAPLPPNGLAGLDPLADDDHPQTAPTPTSMPVPVQLSERLNTLAIKLIQDFGLEKGNPAMALLPVRRMVASYEEELTYRALEWASRNASKNPISLAEIKLREGNHPWENEPPPRTAAPTDPVRAYIESSPIYQELMSNRHSTDPEYRQRCLKIGALDEVAPELRSDLDVYLAMSEYDFVLALATHTKRLAAPAIPTGA